MLATDGVRSSSLVKLFLVAFTGLYIFSLCNCILPPSMRSLKLLNKSKASVHRLFLFISIIPQTHVLGQKIMGCIFGCLPEVSCCLLVSENIYSTSFQDITDCFFPYCVLNMLFARKSSYFSSCSGTKLSSLLRSRTIFLSISK